MGLRKMKMARRDVSGDRIARGQKEKGSVSVIGQAEVEASVRQRSSEFKFVARYTREMRSMMDALNSDEEDRTATVAFNDDGFV